MRRDRFELPGIDGREDAPRFRDNAFEAMHQLLFRDGSAFGKLGRTITNVCGTADARDDPFRKLPHRCKIRLPMLLRCGLKTTPYLVVASADSDSA